MAINEKDSGKTTADRELYKSKCNEKVLAAKKFEEIRR